MGAPALASAEVIVIGGGVVGVSTLYHLAAFGCHRSLLIERDCLGSGSTRAAAGGIRAQFSDELNIRVALECIRRFERFHDEIGVDIDFRQWGYLFLLEPPDVPGFRKTVALQHSLGVPVSLISPQQAQDLVPGLDVTGIAEATFCPIDGYATPAAVVAGYAAAARRSGARIVEGCVVESIVHEGGMVSGVKTSQGFIR
jgi:sarcosine oxidase subunit beta